MNTKLQELTDKIYLEGVEKGKDEARKIVEQAQNDAANIVAKANAEAAKIIKIAEENAAAVAKNTQSELQLFARQSVNALKTEITDLICGNVIAESVKPAVADKEFMQKMMLTLVNAWSANQDVVIEARDAEALTAYFKSNTKDLLNKGVKIVQANNVKADFTISPAGQGYKITFGEDEFAAYFKEFLRPALVEMLF